MQQLSLTLGWLDELGFECFFQGRTAQAPVLSVGRAHVDGIQRLWDGFRRQYAENGHTRGKNI